jgi:hypothetical protein
MINGPVKQGGRGQRSANFDASLSRLSRGARRELQPKIVPAGQDRPRADRAGSAAVRAERRAGFVRGYRCSSGPARDSAVHRTALRIRHPTMLRAVARATRCQVLRDRRGEGHRCRPCRGSRSRHRPSEAEQGSVAHRICDMQFAMRSAWAQPRETVEAQVVCGDRERDQRGVRLDVTAVRRDHGDTAAARVEFDRVIDTFAFMPRKFGETCVAVGH